MAEHAPSGVSVRAPAADPTPTSLIALVEQLTGRIEALLRSTRELPAQQRRLDLLEAGMAALQQRVDALTRQDEATSQALQSLTERARLLAHDRQSEIVSPRQVMAAPALAMPAGGAVGTQEEPFIVTIGSIPTEGEVRRLREAIEHLPSVAAVEASTLDAGSVRFTVRLRETWPRSSFTRQMSWLEGLRLSLIFTGPDGLRADLLSSEGGPPTQQSSWLRRLVRRPRSAPHPAVGRAMGSGQ